MRIADIDLNKEVMIVAEIGNNHEGSYSLAEDLIGLAAEAGAHAVKFETFIPEKLVSKTETARIQQLKKYQLSYEQFSDLKKVADRNNIIFISTPFDIESAMFLDHLVPAFKIASGDNNFLPLIAAIAETTKPIMLSAGLTTIEEIKIVRPGTAMREGPIIRARKSGPGARWTQRPGARSPPLRRSEGPGTWSCRRA